MKFVEGKFGEAMEYLQESPGGARDAVSNGAFINEPQGHKFKPHWGYLTLKRLLDIVGAIGIALVFLPAGILIPVLIRRDGGPAMFRQERVGEDGKPFQIYKFRSMVVNAEEHLNQVLNGYAEKRKEWDESQKLIDDPRITRLGRFLRKTSLDELPQLINVLKGEMSLVGPRPIVQSEICRYGKWFRYYIAVKPGLTGLWQVRGRNDVSYARRVALDRRYAMSQSILLDIYLVAITPMVMLRKSGY